MNTAAKCPHCLQQKPRSKDINHVMLSGTVSTTPTLVGIKHNKKMCVFTFLNTETFLTGGGQKQEHHNLITVEVLGRNAMKYYETLRKGGHYLITGYVRVDDISGVERARIRAFNIQEE